MASFVIFLALLALGQCQRYETRFNTIDLEDKINVEQYRKEFKEVNYKLNKLSQVLDKVYSTINGVQDVVGYPTTLEQALEITDVQTKDGQNFNVVYNTDKIVKYVDSEGEIALPKGSSLLTVKHEGTQKYWNLMKKSDVIIYHHHGSPVMVYTYNKEGELRQTLLGNPFEDVEAKFSMVIPEETFFTVQVMDKEDESFAVLSYSFFPGFVQEYHLKYPVEEQEGTIYKPTYLVRQYFGLEDVEPIFVNDQDYQQYNRIPRSHRYTTKNVIDKVLRQYLGQQLPSEYRRFSRHIMTPRYIQKYNTPSRFFNPTQELPIEYYIKKSLGVPRYNKIQGILRQLVKKNLLPVEILRDLPIQSYEKVEGLLRHLIKKDILPIDLLRDLQTETFENYEDVDTILPREIREYLYKFDMTPQELRKYFEDIPSHIRRYFLNTPRDVLRYLEAIREESPMYLDTIPQYVRQYLENTPMDVKKFFENTPEEVKNYYNVLPMYLRKYHQIIPRIISRYFQTIPEEIHTEIPRHVREYLESTPEEVKSFFINTPEHIRSYFGKMPVHIRKYFQKTPRDVRRFFETKGDKTYEQVLPTYLRNYFQTKPSQYEAIPTRYIPTLPRVNKYTIPSYHKLPKYLRSEEQY